MTLRRLLIAVAVAAQGVLSGCAPGLTAGEAETSAETPTGVKTNGGITLAAHEKGRGKPILLLHGLGTSSYTWRLIEADLARTHHVIALDLKGFGDSDKPLDEHYSVADQAQLVGNYIKAHDLRDVIVVGHSFGGAVALTTAITQADAGERRIQRLVLIDAVAYRQPMPFFFKVLRTPVIGAIGMELVPPEVQISQAMSIAYYNDRKVEPETIQNYAAPLRSEGGRHALFHTINSLEPEKADLMAPRYRELKLPALLLWCDHDRIVPLPFGKKLAADLPNARIEIIENCGHIPQEEQPTDTVRAIQRFIQ